MVGSERVPGDMGKKARFMSGGHGYWTRMVAVQWGGSTVMSIWDWQGSISRRAMSRSMQLYTQQSYTASRAA